MAWCQPESIPTSSALCETENATSGGRKLALALSALTGATAVALTAISWPFVLPAFRKICLPYVPATPQQIGNVLKALRGRQGNLIDLGSGDGRVVLATAAAGFHSTGVELNPWLVLYSRARAYWKRVHNTAGLVSTARTRPAACVFHRADLFNTDLTPYNNIVVFGVGQMMTQLENQLTSQLMSTTGAEAVTGRVTCIIACRFPLPSWQVERVIGEGVDTVWLYTLPHATAGANS